MALSIVTGTQASATSTNTVTTASIAVTAGEILLMGVNGDTSAPATVTLALSDTAGGTWSQRVMGDGTATPGEEGFAAWWSRPCPTSTSFTVTATVTALSVGTSAAIVVQPYRIVGADTTTPFGATGFGKDTANTLAPAGAITSTSAGSTMFAGASDWNQLGTPTSSDLTLATYNLASWISGAYGYKTLGATGAQAFNLDAPGTGAARWNWAAVEVIPAASGSPDPVPAQPRVYPSAAAIHAAGW